ncbi:MAG: hypothetical protein VZS44_03800 [Bacilli bacterium]|nr:hypothetical protein [Bacilli bacterium]
MFNEKQSIERLNKIKAILEVIWESDNIKDISNKTKIATSSIQRYLNNDDLLREAGADDKDILKIKKWLLNAKMNGLSKGGKKTQSIYGDSYTRIGDGKFSGIGKNKKR